MQNTISFTATELTNIDSQIYKGIQAFVPCKKGLNDKKIPCKGAKGWEKGLIDREALKTFKDMTMIAMVLGNNYIAIDQDGITAIEKLNSLGFDLPETLVISSNPGERQAFIYKIEKPFEHFSIKTGDSEQLEFRTGKHYQVILGIHPGTNKPYYTNNLEIATISKNHPIYEFLQSKGNLKAIKSVNSSVNNFSTDIPFLEYFLTGSDRQLLVDGVDQGGRNNAGYKLAANLIGTANRLDELKIKYQSEPEELFEQYCNKCNPVIDSTESITIWNSATNSNPEPTLQDDELKELNALWNGELTIEENIDNYENNSISIKFEKLDKIVENFRENNNYTSSQVSQIAQKIFAKVFNRVSNFNDKGLVDYIQKSLSETIINDEHKQILRDGIDAIRKSKTNDDSVKRIFSDLSLHGMLEKYAEFNNIPLEHLVSSFITTCSSVISKKAVFNFNTTGKCSSNIFTIFSGASTSGKSLVVKPFVDPLKRLANQANAKYISDSRSDKQAQEFWKSLSKDEKKVYWQMITHESDIPFDMTPQKMFDDCFPKLVKGNPFVISDASMQEITRMSGQFKDYGLLISPDEITDFLSGVDTINNAKNASALNEMIRIWNGESTLRNRVSSEAEESDWFRCSLLSTIQTKRFYKVFDIENNEGSGICSRFNYVPINEPIRVPSRFIEDENEIIDISDAVEAFYLKIQNKMAQFIDPEKGLLIRNTKISHTVWSKFREKCIQKSEQVVDNNEAFEQWLNRLPEQVARIALTIHCIRFADGLETDLTRVSEASMFKACVYGLDMIERASIVYKHALSEKSEIIDQEKLFLFEEFISKATKIMEKSEKDFVNVSDFATHAFCRNKKVLKEYAAKDAKYLRKPEILTMFNDVAKHGLGMFDYKTGILKLI